MSADGSRPAHQDDLLLQHLRNFLGIIDQSAIDMLRGRLRWLQLVGGETLMRQGETGEELYLLVSGRLRVYIEEDDQRRIVREVSRGEVVGEMSLIADAPRSATVVAIRDSVLVSLGKEDFEQLQATSPQVTLALTRQIIERLRTERGPTVADRPVTMAVLPVSAGVDAADFARELAGELATRGRVVVLDAAEVERRVRAEHAVGAPGDDGHAQRSLAITFDELEGTHDYLLLVGDATPTEWTHRCARHADEILLLADAQAEPAIHANESAFLVDRPPHAEAAEILVLLHPAGTAMPQGTRRWLTRRPLRDHIHLRRGHAPDMARLARIQSRTAVGLVLAGGGARGFAHLGIFRALQERGIDVDYVGGTSIGAVMAALVATDRPWQELQTVARTEFGRGPTSDYTLLPLISLIKGRRLRRIVRLAIAEIIGEGAGLEDLWKGFYCIATNFSKASEMVLRQGDLVRSLLASAAIPGALPPVVMDGDLLCDGGTFNNFPVDVMRRMRGVGTVIGVDLSLTKSRRIEIDEVPSGWALLLDRLRPRPRRRYRLPSLSVLLINSTILYSLSRQRQARALTDLYFNPPLDRVGMLDWKRFDQVVQQGYEHALQVLGERVPAPVPSPEMVHGGLALHQQR